MIHGLEAACETISSASRSRCSIMAAFLIRQPMPGVLLTLAQQYAYVFPNDSALAMLTGLGPLAEIGAGTGDWAHRLRSIGADIVAFDQAPLDGNRANRYHQEAGPGLTSSRAIRPCWPVTLTGACFCAGRRCSRRWVIA